MLRLKEISYWWKPDVISSEKVNRFIDMYPIFKNDVIVRLLRVRRRPGDSIILIH
nr:hypothetical protein [Candidatus Freyarchaeota archaeon]